MEMRKKNTSTGTNAETNGEYSVFPPSEVANTPLWRKLHQNLDQHPLTLVVFAPALRELKIANEGISLGEKLEHLRGLLTGVPTSMQPPSNPTL